MLSLKYFSLEFGPILHLTLRIWFDGLQVCWVKKEAQSYVVYTLTWEITKPVKTKTPGQIVLVANIRTSKNIR